MLLCSLVLCVLLSLNLSKAEGIPSDARTAAKKFQSALTQQSLQSILSSIEERLRNLDTIYSMQYSPSVEGKLETYGRKLESVEAKIARLEAVMSNELDKISENISSRNFKDDLSRDHLLRKIDSLYDRVNHRLIFAESKMELIERKIENKLDAVLLRIDKMEDSLEIKDADTQGELADVLSCIEEIKTRTNSIENKIVNVTKTLDKDTTRKDIQSDQTIFSSTYENITATVRRDMKENFEVLSNKIVDFHETSWQTYDRLERTLRSMSLVSNLTRYEIQNGLRSLTVEVGRLGGGGGLVTDFSKDTSKLQELDKKIDSNFERLMLAQNLFIENCYRLQKDESQLESKIGEVLDEMINTFNAKTAVEPKDIKRLEQIIKNHNQGVRNGFKNLGSLLYESRMTKTQIEEGFRSLDSIKTDLAKLNSSACDGEENVTYRKVEEAVFLLENLQNTTIEVNRSIHDVIADGIATNHLQQTVEKLEAFVGTNMQEILQNQTEDYTNLLKKSVKNIENNINRTEIIFNDYYSHHFKLFLEEYARNYIKRINEIFSANKTEDTVRNTTKINIAKGLDRDLLETIRTNCFPSNDYVNSGDSSTLSCLKGILNEDVIDMIKNYCTMSVELSNEACLRQITGLTSNGNEVEKIDDAIVETIKKNCFDENFAMNSVDFDCLRRVLKEEELQKIKTYCLFYTTLSDEECLRNITGLQYSKNIMEELGYQAIEIIRSNCFPSIDLRSLNNNTTSFGCLRGVLNDSHIQKIRSYCLLNLTWSEDACLMSIIGFKSNANITEELGIEAVEIIKSNCFPSIDLRNYENNTAKYGCLRGYLNDSIMEKIKSYCLLNVAKSEEACLMNITGLKSNANFTEELGIETIAIIKSNCFPSIDLRSSENNTINYACLRGLLNDSIIEKIQSYCLFNVEKSEEACLANITGIKSNANITEELGIEAIETIKVNCFPSLDLRNSERSSNFECLKGFLNDSTIAKIGNYCSLSYPSSEETCLRNIAGLTLSKNIIEKLGGVQIIEIIRTNCFSGNDIRNSKKYLNYQCLQGVLNNTVIEQIKNYCSTINSSLSEESCLKNVTSLKFTDNFLGKINTETLELIKSNCFPAFDVRQSINSFKLECLKGVLDEDVIEEIKNRCTLMAASSEEGCLRNLTDVAATTVFNIETTITNETIAIIRSNCFPEIDLRISENSTNFECLKGLLSNDTVKSIIDYCSINMVDLQESCLAKILADFGNISTTNINGNQNTTFNLVANSTNENQRELTVQKTFTGINSTTEIQATTEIDYYQNVDMMVYEDYSSDDL